MSTIHAFVVCPPGLEDVTSAELRALGTDPAPAGVGGLDVHTDEAGLYRMAIGLRTASRILVRVAQFRARGFSDLERHGRSIPWERFSRPGDSIQFRVTSKKSRLYHQGAVAQRLEEAARIAGRDTPGPAREGSGGPRPEVDQLPAQQVVVRLFRDECTVSVDATGDHLHRRGYRLSTAKAPLRENLAAGVLLAAGWDPGTPLVDPMCGAGTLVLEGALLARRMAPGRDRSFGFQGWPTFDPITWERVLTAARSEELPRAPAPLIGADRDGGAVEAARTNAERAGVAADTAFLQRALSATQPPPGPVGCLVTNPPYGTRIGKRNPLRDLYATLGNVARSRFQGWTLVVISSDPVLVGHIGLSLKPCLSTRHGGIGITAWRGTVPG